MDKHYKDLIPLVIFTAFMIIASGLTCGIALRSILTSAFSINDLHSITTISLLGFAASFSHLGNKQRAVRAISGLSSSWLSREIILGSLFLVALLSLYFSYYKIFHLPMDLLFYVASFLSLATIFAIGKVYDLRSQRAWSGMLHIGSPFASSFLLAAAFFQSQTDSSILPVMILWAIDASFFFTRLRQAQDRERKQRAHFQHLITHSMAFLTVRAIITIITAPLLIFMGSIPYLLIATLILIDRIVFYALAIQINPENDISRLRKSILQL